MKLLAILALLAFAGCSAHWNSSPMPNITQPPIEARATPNDCYAKIDAYWHAPRPLGAPGPACVIQEERRDATTACHVTHDTIKWDRFKRDDKHVRIQAPGGYWAVSAEVRNDLSNGIYVRGGNNGTRRTYVPGHNETQGGKPVYVKMGKRSSAVVMRSIADPTWGRVRIAINFCAK